ncbi:MAG: metal-dependent hydrolase [Chloroflexota bacterium]
MKGIAHFISGVAAASFFPAAVTAAKGGSLALALAGAFALLPDTLDFKFARYLEKLDDEIAPTEAGFDAQAIAGRVAAAMKTAFETGRPQTVQLHSLQLGSDRWRQYTVRLEPEMGEVIVRPGPVVSTAQVAYPESDHPTARLGRAVVGVPLVQTYDAETRIDILSGPCLRFERQGSALHVTFLPWHRRWSHSLTLAAMLGSIAWLLLGPVFGVAIGLGMAVHVLQDQLGHMGSNLWWPFSRRRTSGLRLIHSGDPLPNFATVWLALTVCLFNLDRFSASPRLPAGPYLALAVALPVLAMLAAYARERRKKAPPLSVEGLRQADILAEAEEVEL